MTRAMRGRPSGEGAARANLSHAGVPPLGGPWKGRHQGRFHGLFGRPWRRGRRRSFRGLGGGRRRQCGPGQRVEGWAPRRRHVDLGGQRFLVGAQRFPRLLVHGVGENGRVGRRDHGGRWRLGAVPGLRRRLSGCLLGPGLHRVGGGEQQTAQVSRRDGRQHPERVQDLTARVEPEARGLRRLAPRLPPPAIKSRTHFSAPSAPVCAAKP